MQTTMASRGKCFTPKEIETWREKKESLEALARYNARLYYKKWEPDEEE